MPSPGPPGPPGFSGYFYTQDTASDVWTIPHGLGYNPTCISVLDSAFGVVVGDPSFPDLNTVVITFSAAFAGTARVI